MLHNLQKRELLPEVRSYLPDGYLPDGYLPDGTALWLGEQLRCGKS